MKSDVKPPIKAKRRVTLEEFFADSEVAEQFSVVSRVEAGVVWLDEHIPEWVENVDANNLSMWLASRCVLGMNALAKGLEVGSKSWSEFVRDLGLTLDETIAFGFHKLKDTNVGGREYSLLNKAWGFVIEERLGTQHFVEVDPKVILRAFNGSGQEITARGFVDTPEADAITQARSVGMDILTLMDDGKVTMLTVGSREPEEIRLVSDPDLVADLEASVAEHGESITVSNKCTCAKCGRKFETEFGLVKHKERAHSDRGWVN